MFLNDPRAVMRGLVIINRIGGDDQPTYTPPAPPTLPTAADLYSQANAYAQANQPLAFGSREGALNDLKDPTSYYQSFQPTSFEQALGNQQFQNIWPNQEAYIQNLLSKSGMAYSPVEATTLGNAYGNLSTNIGEYLNTQADNRANQSLMARLGIDPQSITNPYVQTGANQGNAQANLNYGYQQSLAQQQYQQQMNQYQQDQARNGLIGQGAGALVGGAAGSFFGNPLLGAQLGSGIGGAVTGGGNNLGQTFQGASGMGGFGSFNNPFGSGDSTGNNGVQMVNNSMQQGYGSNLGGINQLPSNPFGG